MNFKYKFKDRNLLDLALTQSGINHINNNEKLEFLGDRVLGLCIAKLLYDLFKNESEGELARRHSILVSTDTLSKIALKYNLDKMLHHGHITSGKINHILANAFEAVLGAIFIDGGFNKVFKEIELIYKDIILNDVKPPKDAKTTLQELVQNSDKNSLPEYEYFEPTGLVHNPVFKVSVSAFGKKAFGEGGSKKLASIEAARNLLKILDFRTNNN